MTDDRMVLIEARQKAYDGNFLRALAETVLQIIMDADVEALIGAGRHERRTGGSPTATAIATGHWRRGSARSTCGSRSCARAPIFPACLLPRSRSLATALRVHGNPFQEPAAVTAAPIAAILEPVSSLYIRQ